MPAGYILKKIVAKFFYPVPICLLVLVLGLILLVFTWRKKTGTGLVALGTLLLFLFSTDYVSSGLLRRLEYRHPAHQPTAAAPLPNAAGAPGWICVLGSGWSPETLLPVTSRTDDAFLDRMVEGTRLARLYPDARIIVVIAAEIHARHKQRFLEDWASIMQIDPARYELVSEVRDTMTEARAIKELIGNDPVFLVTSASHMPRALQVFARHGIHAEPAPCGHHTLPRYRNNFHPDYIMPYAMNVRKSEQALYEYMGLTWEWVKQLGE